MKPRSSGSVVRLAAPLRALAHRFSFLLLVLACVALMMVGKVESLSIDTARARVTDAFAPILDAISRPAATAAYRGQADPCRRGLALCGGGGDCRRGWSR